MEDLERNLLVEAGAGSGKTTSLVDRMVALVRNRACTVDRIAAVTFTRKAAAELRQRFQVKLEEVAARLPADHSDHPVLQAAIRDIDLAFLGTIHAFCAKLLRERPLEAGLDPGFREVQESEAERMQRRFWVEFLERMATDGDPRLGELERLGIQPDLLEDAFIKLVANPDVDFGFDAVDPPDPNEMRKVRARFDELLDRAERLMRGRKPPDGWDPFGRRLRTLLYWRRSLDWSDQSAFFDALARVHLKKGKPVQKRWADTAQGKAAAKQLGAAVAAFAGADGAADKVLRQWWAYRYPVAIGVARDAAGAFARQRKDRGEVDFQDLLVHTAALLRDDPQARRDLGRRYQRVLVDEFQDTDPLQAEILLLLASDPETGSGLAHRHAAPRRPLRGGRPQAEHLPLSARRHRAVRGGQETLRGLRRRAAARSQLPFPESDRDAGEGRLRPGGVLRGRGHGPAGEVRSASDPARRGSGVASRLRGRGRKAGRCGGGRGRAHRG